MALVTGANRGLGKAFVEYLTKHGYQVFACARNTNDITMTDTCIPIVMDISNDESIIRAAHEIASYTPTIDLLINNAGINSRSATGNNPKKVSSLAELDRQSLNQLFNVNATSQILVIKYLHGMLASDAFIINITADRASFHDEFENATANYGYRSSKIALNMLTFCLTWDLPAARVTAVHPGNVRTDMNPHGATQPYDAAALIITNIVDGWKDEFRGAFTRYDGSLYPL